VDKKEDKKQVPKFAYIRAYEANLLYDSDALAGTVGTRGEEQGIGRGTGKQTGGLIKWAGSFQDDSEDEIEGEGGGREVWADRYVCIPHTVYASIWVIHLYDDLALSVRGPTVLKTYWSTIACPRRETAECGSS
jgi:hypothetical protein